MLQTVVGCWPRPFALCSGHIARSCFPSALAGECGHVTYCSWWNVKGVMGTTSRTDPQRPPTHVLHTYSIYAPQGSTESLEAMWRRRLLSTREKEPGSLHHHLEESYLLIPNTSFIFMWREINLYRVWATMYKYFTAANIILDNIPTVWSHTRKP